MTAIFKTRYFSSLTALLCAALVASCGGRFSPTAEAAAKLERTSGGRAKIGVNAFLWRATLDTLAFLPLKSADPFGGVIISDWYSDPASPRERLRLVVYILDRRLRADALKLSVFRERRRKSGWVAVASPPEIAIALESTILLRARDLKSQYAR